MTFRPSEILVIRFSSLGDVVLSAAVLHAIAGACPESKITLATKVAYQPLFDNFDAAVDVVPFHPGESFLSYRSHLARVGYDYILDLHGSIRSVLLSSTLRAGRRARIRKHVAARAAMVRSKTGLDRPLSALRAYMSAMNSLGLHTEDAYPELSLSADEEDRVARHRGDYPSCIGIGWGAHWPTKIVPPEVWTGVLDRLIQDLPLRLRLFGLESDRAAIAAFVQEWQARQPRIEMQIECNHSLREVMIRLASCSVLVSSDSGLMHLGAAIGIPSFGLFGPTHPSLGFAPAGPGARPFHGGTFCSPCHRHGSAPCFRDRRFCFDDLNLDEIASAIRTAIANSTPTEDKDTHG